MKKAWKQIARAAGFLGIFFGAQVTSGMLLSICGYLYAGSRIQTGNAADFQAYTDAALEFADRYMSLAVLAAALVTIGVYLIIFAARKVNPLAQVDAKKISGKDLLFTVIGGLGAILFMNYVMELIPFSDHLIEILNSEVDKFNEGPLWFEFLNNALAVPVFEEVVFRGLCYGRLRRGMPEIVAALITSIVFGLGHTGFVWIIWAFVVGMILNYARSRTGSVLAPIVIHMMVNAFSVVYNNRILVLPETGVFYVIATAVGAVLLAVYFFGLYKVTKKEKAEGKIKEPLLEKEEVSSKEETTVVVM